MAVKPIPEAYHTVTPYLIIEGAATAIEFYKKAFGAKELFQVPGAGGKDRTRGDQDWRFADHARRCVS